MTKKEQVRVLVFGSVLGFFLGCIVLLFFIFPVLRSYLGVPEKVLSPVLLYSSLDILLLNMVILAICISLGVSIIMLWYMWQITKHNEDIIFKTREADLGRQYFFSMVLHYLLTPMTKIRWGLHELLEPTTIHESLDAWILNELKTIHTTSEKAVQAVNDLLDVVELNSAKMDYSFIAVTISEVGKLIIEDITAVKKNTNMRNISVEIAQSDLSPTRYVNIDKKKFSTVTRTLIENAIKYNKNNGKVVVRLFDDHEGFHMEISDTGIGIPSSDQDKVFKEFFRGTNSEEVSDGFGIGLFMVKKFVEHHGGTIRFISRKDEGTTFLVDLPLYLEHISS